MYLHVMCEILFLSQLLKYGDHEKLCLWNKLSQRDNCNNCNSILGLELYAT
jgi:hypothetical protein